MSNPISLLPTVPRLETEYDSDEKRRSMDKDESITDVVVKEVIDDPFLPAGEYTEDEYKKLVKKVDRYLLPLMWWCYGIQQSDKTSIGTQALFGMREDTGLVGNQYAWLTTIFYITYLFCEFPSVFLLQKYPMGKVLSSFMICWGVIVACVSACNNFEQLLAVRALQGAFECCISPGFLLVIAAWYRTREHTSRSLIFQSANAGYGIIVDLSLYGIGSAAKANPNGLAAWRAIGLFLGGSTVLAALVCFVLLGTPKEVFWLTEEEKKMANTRIIVNQAGDDSQKKWEWSHVRDAFTDPVCYFMFFNTFLASIPNGGITTFGSLLNKSFGFTDLEVILFTIPRSVVSVLWFVVVGLCTSKWKNLRLYFMGFSIIPPFVGFLVMGLTPSTDAYKWVKWGGYLMSVTFVIASFLGWGMVSSNVAGRTKKTIISSVNFVGYCVGNMVGSQLFAAKDAPYYIPGIVGCCICFGLEFLVVCGWRGWYMYQNKKRDRELAESGMSAEESERVGKLNGAADMTDRQNQHFRYAM